MRQECLCKSKPVGDVESRAVHSVRFSRDHVSFLLSLYRPWHYYHWCGGSWFIDTQLSPAIGRGKEVVGEGGEEITSLKISTQIL